MLSFLCSFRRRYIFFPRDADAHEKCVGLVWSPKVDAVVRYYRDQFWAWWVGDGDIVSFVAFVPSAFQRFVS